MENNIKTDKAMKDLVPHVYYQTPTNIKTLLIYFMWQMSYDGGPYLSRQVYLIITTIPFVSMESLSIRKLRKLASRSTRITNEL